MAASHAFNQCLTRQRLKKLAGKFLDERKRGERYFVAPLHQSPSKQFEQSEKSERVRQALNSLPSDLRQVIVMKEFEEMTFQEISETLELPLSTVKSRVYTALKQMRMKLKEIPLEDISINLVSNTGNLNKTAKFAGNQRFLSAN